LLHQNVTFLQYECISVKHRRTKYVPFLIPEKIIDLILILTFLYFLRLIHHHYEKSQQFKIIIIYDYIISKNQIMIT